MNLCIIPYVVVVRIEFLMLRIPTSNGLSFTQKTGKGREPRLALEVQLVPLACDMKISVVRDLTCAKLTHTMVIVELHCHPAILVERH